MSFKVDINKILHEFNTFLPDYDNQLSLQGVKEDDSPFYGTGRVKNLNNSEDEFIVPLFPELEYTNSVIKNLNMYRTRVMRMKHKTCYSYHRDPTKRMHIPLITNENCFMVIEDKIYRYPADGNYYLVDTTKKHTFVNASFEERIHIVGCINENI